MAYTLPINNNVVRPSTSAPYENGKLPASVLVQVPNVKSTCVMDRTAARAFEAMFALALKMLGTLVIKDSGDYRTFQGQIDLFVDRYIPVSKAKYDATPSEHRKIWASAGQYGYPSIYWIKNYAKFNGWPATAASPGTSNHGYALALDVAEENDSDTAPDPITTPFVEWLCLFGPRFGIYASLTSERWHWQYIRGDDIPQAVLDYENQNDEEVDMELKERQQRLFDSRPVTAFTGAPVAPHQVLKFDIANHEGATAAVVTVTATATQGNGGWFSKALPTSFINWWGPGQTVANEITVFLSPEGEFVIINGPTPSHIVVDLVGIWVPTP